MMRFIESGNGKKTNLDQDVKLLIDQGNVPKAIELRTPALTFLKAFGARL